MFGTCAKGYVFSQNISFSTLSGLQLCLAKTPTHGVTSRADTSPHRGAFLEGHPPKQGGAAIIKDRKMRTCASHESTRSAHLCLTALSCFLLLVTLRAKEDLLVSPHMSHPLLLVCVCISFLSKAVVLPSASHGAPHLPCRTSGFGGMRCRAAVFMDASKSLFASVVTFLLHVRFYVSDLSLLDPSLTVSVGLAKFVCSFWPSSSASSFEPPCSMTASGTAMSSVTSCPCPLRSRKSPKRVFTRGMRS